MLLLTFVEYESRGLRRVHNLGCVWHLRLDADEMVSLITATTAAATTLCRAATVASAETRSYN